MLTDFQRVSFPATEDAFIGRALQRIRSLPVAPNLLGRQFTVDAPDRGWTSDITYIDTGEGWLYPAAAIE